MNTGTDLMAEINAQRSRNVGSITGQVGNALIPTPEERMAQKASARAMEESTRSLTEAEQASTAGLMRDIHKMGGKDAFGAGVDPETYITSTVRNMTPADLPRLDKWHAALVAQTGATRPRVGAGNQVPLSYRAMKDELDAQQRLVTGIQMKYRDPLTGLLNRMPPEEEAQVSAGYARIGELTVAMAGVSGVKPPAPLGAVPPPASPVPTSPAPAGAPRATFTLADLQATPEWARMTPAQQQEAVTKARTQGVLKE